MLNIKNEKYAVVIGAGSEQVFAMKKAKDNGYQLIAFDSNPEAEGFKYATYCYQVEPFSFEAIAEKLAHHEFEFIVPTPIGRLLSLVGQLNDHFSKRGVSQLTADLCVSKMSCSNVLSKSGLAQAKQKSLSPDLLTEDQIRNFGYPCILKPEYGSGSRGVRVLLTEDDLHLVEEHLTSLQINEKSVVEELLDGEEFGVDGIVVDGCFHLRLARKKEMTPLPYRQEIGYTTEQTLSADKYQQLKDTMSQAAAALKMDFNLINADVIHCNDAFYIIDISARPAGYLCTSTIYPYATGECLYQLFFDAVLGEAVPPAPLIKPSYLAFFPFKGHVVCRPTFKNEKVISYTCQVEVGDFLEEAKEGQSVIHRGYVFTEDKDTLVQVLSEFKLESS